MIDSEFRKPYQTLCVDPFIRLAIKSGLHPVAITGAALVSGVMVIPALATGHSYLALALLFFSGYCDTLDGSLARDTGQASALGTVCDIVSDRIVEFSVIFGLFLSAPEERGLLCLLMSGSVLICATTFLVVGIFTPNDSEKGFHYSPGLMERTEAFLFFGAMMLFPSLFVYLASIFSLMVLLTGLIRIRDFAGNTR